ncbi:cupin domain-containing protein [Roseovarius sp. EL26]|uniref:cupin domain-containing protein n=1 Tax=Roseovarius sp. EL26 TaxID=2126672 RepID=UPI0013C4D9DF|nr:cupin domain-containing protein [Roseovarius sp. EL26]
MTFKYKPGDDVGPLDDWPFDNPLSDYVIQEGAPRTSGRIDAGGPGHTSRYGIWRCTKGAFDCTEQGDELMMVLSGQCRVIEHANGDICELAAGDSLFVRDGSRVTWDIREDVTKVFFGHKSDGY